MEKMTSLSSNQSVPVVKRHQQNLCICYSIRQAGLCVWAKRITVATKVVISARKVGVRFWQICISLVHMKSHSNSQYYKMKITDKKQIKYALGTLGIGALIYGLYRIYKHFQLPNPTKSGINSSFSANEADESRDEASFISQSNEHCPYDILIEDAFKEELCRGTISCIQHLKDISYRIILSLMKGNSYQGIVNIAFHLQGLPAQEEHLSVNFSGSGVKFLMVNGQVLDAKEINYSKHKILIPRQLLRDKAKNHIEVIFENFYSFFDEGLATYFMVDEHQKYSLRQQVIYSVNGCLDAEKIIPCFNCLNECRVQMEVIHSDTFEVFSNTSKSLQRLCSAAEYQKYPFLFDLTSSALNKSFKLNESTLSNYSGIQNSLSMSYSSVNYYNRKKANSHFYKERLPCIQHMFIFSSSVIELQPSAASNPLDSELLLRYFCKHTESHRLVKNVNKVHNYILDVFRRLASERIEGNINKIDILIIADREVEGYFAPGVLLLCEDSLKQATISIRCFYLIVRALLGLIQLQKGNKLLALKEVIALNELVFVKFQEFRNYIFVKNKKFEKVRELVRNQKFEDFLSQKEAYFLRYFAKELRFVVKEDIVNKVSFQLANLMIPFDRSAPEEFWENFIANYNFLSPLIVQPFIKLGLRKMEVPRDPKILEQAKGCFSNSKYWLSFYTNEEISDSLPKFIEVEAYGLEQRLTQVKVKQKFKDYITEKYEMYLPIRSNITEAETMYLEFKQFNQTKNFHHVSVLRGEAKRITYFCKHALVPERVQINCSLMAWKLLKTLKLYPRDQQKYALISVFEGLP